MQVYVKLFSRFRAQLPHEAKGEAAIELPAGSTLADLLAQLGIKGRVKLMTINGVPETDRGYSLQPGDTIHVFPVVVGG